VKWNNGGRSIDLTNEVKDTEGTVHNYEKEKSIMPWESEVAVALRERIRQDDETQLTAAGDMWKEVPFSFFYGNNDKTIDAVVADVVESTISPAHVPTEVSKNLEGLIGPATLVKKGIKIMWLATFRAE